MQFHLLKIFRDHLMHQFVCLLLKIRSPYEENEEKDEAHISETAPEIRDVFGESDDEEPTEYEAVQNNLDEDANVCNYY